VYGANAGLTKNSSLALLLVPPQPYLAHVRPTDRLRVHTFPYIVIKGRH